MRAQFRILISVGVVVIVVTALLALRRTEAQAQTTYRAPRTADGKPDLNGIWQANNTAHYDLESHAPKEGPIPEMGAVGGFPGGIGVVEGGDIPYQPEALAKKKANGENWLKLDPVVKCYMPGVPRSTYMPFPFQIIESPDEILMVYEFPNASRTVHMKSKDEGPSDFWMGWSRGRWEGETLVVDVTNFNDKTWFDRSGNFHSDQLHVVERYSRIDRDHLSYEATIEDPKVFTRPWKISMPLYRRIEKNMQLVEYNCVPFVSDILYGHLKRKTQ
jgi:hypothetical protein